MAEGSARTKLATVALVIVGFALGFAEFIVIGITPDIAEEYGISLASAVYGNDIYQRHHSS